jgi:hypothetical protein
MWPTRQHGFMAAWDSLTRSTIGESGNPRSPRGGDVGAPGQRRRPSGKLSAVDQRVPPLGLRLDFVLIGRLREVLDGQATTETELRSLSERADAWARIVENQIQGSERRLRAFAADPAPPLAEVRAELRRIDMLRPQLAELRPLLAELEKRARQLRTGWLTHSG